MTGKLIKNEFKMSSHTMGMIYLAAAVTVGIMALAYAFDISWISVVATIALIIISIIAVVVTFVCVVANFQKTLYGNQGYLSFTLPVTSGQLLASKTIVSFVWMLLSYAVGIGIWIGVYLYSTAMIGDDVMAAIKLMLNLFASLPSATTIKVIVVAIVLVIFIKIVTLIAQLFFAITISNTRSFQKLGVFGPIIMFFAIFLVVTVISAALSNNVPISLLASTNGIELSFSQAMAHSEGIAIGVTGVAFDVITSIFLFMMTSLIMDTKINIK